MEVHIGKRIDGGKGENSLNIGFVVGSINSLIELENGI